MAATPKKSKRRKRRTVDPRASHFRNETTADSHAAASRASGNLLNHAPASRRSRAIPTNVRPPTPDRPRNAALGQLWREKNVASSTTPRPLSTPPRPTSRVHVGAVLDQQLGDLQRGGLAAPHAVVKNAFASRVHLGCGDGRRGAGRRGHRVRSPPQSILLGWWGEGAETNSASMREHP